MKIIFGLGNPGAQYEKTLHNAGYLAIGHLAQALSAGAFRSDRKALVAQAFLAQEKILLVQPTTYMNESGQCVREMMKYYQLGCEDIIVVYDDIDLPMGRVRVRGFGGAGTHNGMRSILAEIGDESFARVRIGIGPPRYPDLAQYVLSTPRGTDQEAFLQGVLQGAQAAQSLLTDGLVATQQQYNKNSHQEEEKE